MRFTPKTEEQIHEENLFPEGEYDFQCIEANDAVSKSGNEMIAHHGRPAITDEPASTNKPTSVAVSNPRPNRTPTG